LSMKSRKWMLFRRLSGILPSSRFNMA
jgi:hypothetical protein